MIIISNGHSKFPLRIAAAEAAKRGRLARFITGAYPSPWLRLLARVGVLDRRPGVARFLDRDEVIPGNRITSLWLSELVVGLGLALRRRGRLPSLSDRLVEGGMRLYGYRARAVTGRVAADLYHYRAGYGHGSVAAAKRRGMVALCDHSIAHPAVLQYLVDNKGKLPPPGEVGPMNAIWRRILDDIEQADHVVVNSDFVKQTFVHQGWDADRVHVIYFGIEGRFLDSIPVTVTAKHGPLRLLFAGSFDARKGADELAAALSGMDDVPWRLAIAGPMNPAMAEKHAAFLGDPRVEVLGVLSSGDLARRMAEARIFVFPSLAEGSARVVFEALAAGCYVITTANAGSIVEDGVHGAVVPCGDAAAIAAAVLRAAAHGDEVARIGAANAGLFRRAYRQEDYGDAINRLYRSLIARRETRAAAATADRGGLFSSRREAC